MTPLDGRGGGGRAGFLDAAVVEEVEVAAEAPATADDASDDDGGFRFCEAAPTIPPLELLDEDAGAVAAAAIDCREEEEQERSAAGGEGAAKTAARAKGR